MHKQSGAGLDFAAIGGIFSDAAARFAGGISDGSRRRAFPDVQPDLLVTVHGFANPTAPAIIVDGTADVGLAQSCL